MVDTPSSQLQSFLRQLAEIGLNCIDLRVAERLPHQLLNRPDREPAPSREAVVPDEVRRVFHEDGFGRGIVQQGADLGALNWIGAAAVERSLDSQAAALASTRPLRALWSIGNDSERAALAIEFMALANHRKSSAPKSSRTVSAGAPSRQKH